MRFVLADDLLDLFPDLCVFAVVAENVDSSHHDQIQELLAGAVAEAQARFQGADPKAVPEVALWREAFSKAGINPNRFPPSIEALITRIVRGLSVRPINAAVDLANVISIRHVLPLGAHDLDSVAGDLVVGRTKGGESFLPLGAAEEETVGPGEVAYLDDAGVRTRRWVWRQSDLAKVTEASRRVFFPVDAFASTRERAEAAANELQEAATTLLNARCRVHLVDREHPEAEL